ncbi:hypothetical protein [Candidatus Endomicrobiellum agilis]|uniref:hypothetical protein n=1 Tax=Candidatus Endomicrobiellum agilis TaxID=3238957 RepID=UPI003588C2AE|nr:hypothetical protein [Endomicrobium sp.]
MLGEKGLAEYVSYDEVAKASESQGRRDASKIVTIAVSHVEYSTLSLLHHNLRTPPILSLPTLLLSPLSMLIMGRQH